MESIFINREQSWLEFNERVLEEAQDTTNPLMERLKFLAISASNLDEFFMVRVPPIWHGERPDATGLSPAAQITTITAQVKAMVAKQYNCFTRSILPAMEKEGITLLTYQQLDDKLRAYVDAYFHEVLYQILTPMAIDQSRPFPTLNNRTVNLFIELVTDSDNLPVRTVEWDEEDGRWRIIEERGGGPRYAVMQVPTVVPRVFALPGFHRYIMLEEIILAHIERLFMGYEVKRTALFRVTRSSDLTIDEEETDDLLVELARSIRDRRWGDPMRVEIVNAKKGLSSAAKALLNKALGLTPEKIYELSGPLDLTAWMNFALDPEFGRLRHKPILPKPAPDFISERSMFDVIRERDVLVHHPYMSFDCVVRFVQEAAADERVLAIKQTLYRVSGQSPIIAALIKAAESGKQVTVLLELKARFDEENNINWARLLERSGVHVVYGLIGLKTHCKCCLVVRREDDGIRRYMHLSTGNYNESTAKLYTDTGFFTCRETFGQDASVLFNVLTGYSKTMEWQKFTVAPATLRPELLRLIEEEIAQAQAGNPAEIAAKMNALSDIEMIQALYRASQAGVKIRLLVRGICCLQSGVPGLSENITVSSVVDRYLEHNRLYIFGAASRRRVFLSSADWMPRNLDRRVEVLFPIEDPLLQNELMAQLELSLADNVKRRVQQPDGTYKKPSRRGHGAVQSQLEHHRRTSEQHKAATEGA
ncbi:MAG: polyphosphate kinase 1 [Defluviitaleaceae bacterium]|nr:polyphosphate kinase 1 [Defluviitaleaceae bacterium]MCL2239210.1 polyphosphate kinase 1 [Defluviitaleaceae bacterium]MCL2240319.1 polyphosphate kinase 1 [Defluviitaleaceae bacterium]